MSDDAFETEGYGSIIKHVNLTAQSAGGGSTVWDPIGLYPGAGYSTNWADAVAAVQALQPPTQIVIIGRPGEDTITIPGGTWELNQTTLIGATGYPDTGTDYRAYQELLFVVTEGDNQNPCWLKGCVGLKNMFFRATDYENSAVYGTGGDITAIDGSTVTFTTHSGAYTFSSKDVGKWIRVGWISPYQNFGSDVATVENRGTFKITAVVDDNTIQYTNDNGGAAGTDANNSDIGWSLCTSVFIVDNDAPSGQEFTLDNVDFRFGGDYNWGSLFLESNQSLMLRLKNAASVRWYSLLVDGWMALQSDGGGSWVGSLAFVGNGDVDVYPMSGTQVRTWQEAINTWTLHMPYTVYMPSDTNNWTLGTPENVHEALNQLAQRVKALEP